MLTVDHPKKLKDTNFISNALVCCPLKAMIFK